MPVKTPQERALIGALGGYTKWSAAADPAIAAAAAQGKREARAKLTALIARRHLTEAAQEYADAQRRLADLGLAVES